MGLVGGLRESAAVVYMPPSAVTCIGHVMVALVRSRDFVYIPENMSGGAMA